jgi:hypothetical protein
MKKHDRVEIRLHAFLTSKLDGNEWPVSHPTHSIPWKAAPIEKEDG